MKNFQFYKDVNKSLLFFFAKLGYITIFFVFFTLSYSILFTPDEPDFGRAFQVFLQLSLFLFMFRDFSPKAEKEAKWLLITSSFCSVIATLFLKNVLSLDILVFMVIPLFYLLILLLPADVLPFSILILYSLDKGLAQWAFYLLFQLGTLHIFSFLFDSRPKRGILPCTVLLLYFFVIGQVGYNVSFLHEPARLTALVSGACIIYLSLRRRSTIAFFICFLIYLSGSIGLGVVSIASAPGGENISYPIPFLFIGTHAFLFLGFYLFQRNLPAAKQPLVPLLFGAILYFLPYFPNLEWLEGWIEGLDLFLLLLGFILFVCGEENE